MVAFWFIHAWLALAAAPIAAAAITVHLLNRAGQKPVRWAAMQFLQAAMYESRRRLRLERWLLIALRTLMLAMLTLFVARPIAGALRTVAVNADGALLIVMDNGLALQAPGSQVARTLQADAMDALLPLVHNWSGPVAIVPALGEQTVQWLTRVDLVETSLSQTVATAGRADWPNLLVRLKELLSTSTLPSHRRTVLIVTSLTQGNWPRSELLRQPLTQLNDLAGRVLLLDVQPASRENLTITDLSVDAAFAGRDLPIRAATSLVNRGSDQAENLTVVWSVDGREVRRDGPLPLRSGAQHTLVADLPLLAAGEHNVAVRMVSGAADNAPSPDVLTADDQRWASVAVPLRRRIVVIEPEPSAGPSSRASLFVSAVLTSAAQQSAVPLQIDTIAPLDLQTSLIEPADCVLLCDTGPLTEADWQLLQRHLQRGGGLIAWLGPRFAAAQRALPASDSERTARQNVLAGNDINVVSIPPGGDGVVRLVVPAPAVFADLADTSAAVQEPLGTVQSLVRIEPAPGSQVLVQTAGGLPVVAQRQVGSGRSLLLTTSPDLAWSDLAGRPTYPAFLLGLLREAMPRYGAQGQVECGQPIRLVLPAGASVQQSRWIRPDGSSEPARLSLDGGVTAAILPVAPMPGPYQWESDGASRTVLASADALAGDLTEVSPALRSDLEDNGVVMVDRTHLASTLIGKTADEWSRTLAYLVMALVLLEVVLTAAFARARTM